MVHQRATDSLEQHSSDFSFSLTGCRTKSILPINGVRWEYEGGLKFLSAD